MREIQKILKFFDIKKKFRGGKIDGEEKVKERQRKGKRVCYIDSDVWEHLNPQQNLGFGLLLGSWFVG